MGTKLIKKTISKCVCRPDGKKCLVTGRFQSIECLNRDCKKQLQLKQHRFSLLEVLREVCKVCFFHKHRTQKLRFHLKDDELIKVYGNIFDCCIICDKGFHKHLEEVSTKLINSRYERINFYFLENDVLVTESSPSSMCSSPVFSGSEEESVEENASTTEEVQSKSSKGKEKPKVKREAGTKEKREAANKKSEAEAKVKPEAGTKEKRKAANKKSEAEAKVKPEAGTNNTKKARGSNAPAIKRQKC